MSTPTATPPLDLMSSLAPQEQRAVRFLDAMLNSADVEVIGRSSWWDRAKTALETAAASSTSFAETVSTAAAKLTIHTSLSARTGEEIASLTRELADSEVFAEWRELCQSDATYLTSITRVIRTSRKAQ